MVVLKSCFFFSQLLIITASVKFNVINLKGLRCHGRGIDIKSRPFSPRIEQYPAHAAKSLNNALIEINRTVKVSRTVKVL